MTLWIKSFAIISLVCTQAILSLEAAAQAVFWQGDESCENLLDEPVSNIPGGFPLKSVTNGQARYQLPDGGTLRLRLWEAASVPVQGRSFEEAYKNLVEQNPLQENVSDWSGNNVVFAIVASRYALDLDYEHDNDLNLFQLKPGSYKINMNSKVKIVNWAGYETADEESRRKWDKMTCESYHHELGHVLIGAQLFAQAEPMWMDLRGEGEAVISQKTDALFETIMNRVRDRQEKYHDEIETMGPAMSDSRPYTELPFTWLR